MAKRRCKSCKCLFYLTARNPCQKYCSKPDCQRSRKCKWQKEKMKKDEDYPLNQKNAQKRWRQNNPEYYKNYRRKNEEYTKGNREKQLLRNRRRRAIASISENIAKMDASRSKSTDITGVYGLISVQDILFAKMDPKIVKITEMSEH